MGTEYPPKKPPRIRPGTTPAIAVHLKRSNTCRNSSAEAPSPADFPQATANLP